ncbi:MAG: hypothetical protein R3B54_06270 [Bdellovibrionota bacterium]
MKVQNLALLTLFFFTALLFAAEPGETVRSQEGLALLDKIAASLKSLLTWTMA